MNEIEEMVEEMGEKGFWERIVFPGSRLDTKLNMPTFSETMRWIVMLWLKNDDPKEARKLGERIWNDTQIVYYGLLHTSNDPKLPVEERRHANWLSEIIEKFQHLMIRELGVTL